MSLTPYIPLLVAPLVMWRVYARYKRLVGVQAVRPARLWFSMILFPLIFLLMFAVTWVEPLSCGALVGGAVLGAVLSFYGLSLTTYHNEGGLLSYTPNAKIGMALTMMMVGRFSYSMLQRYMAADFNSSAPPSMHQSPLTMVILGIVVGYYPLYSWGIMRWRTRQAAVGVPPTPVAGVVEPEQPLAS